MTMFAFRFLLLCFIASNSYRCNLLTVDAVSDPPDCHHGFFIAHSNSTKRTYFRNITMDTYRNLRPCLMDSPYADTKIRELLPPVDLKEHYFDMLEKTKIFRGVPIHSYHYSGPWIENYYIDYFMKKPFRYFNGLVPLFIQWVDIHLYDYTDFPKGGPPKNTSIPTSTATVDMLLQWLRRDVIYLVVSQDDQGIGSRLMTAFPNILVMSAGGYGHIPIPLIAGEHPYIPPRADNLYGNTVGFYGMPRSDMARYRMLKEFEFAAKHAGMKFTSTHSDKWLQLITDTKFNLAPRGFGRSSFRLVEIIQSVRLPVYVYDDQPWLPYQGSNISVTTFGYAAQLGRAPACIQDLRNTSDIEFSRRMLHVQRVRRHYTYEGVIQQIDEFIKNIHLIGESGLTGSSKISSSSNDISGSIGNGRKVSANYSGSLSDGKEGNSAHMRGVYLRCERVPNKDH